MNPIKKILKLKKEKSKEKEESDEEKLIKNRLKALGYD